MHVLTYSRTSSEQRGGAGTGFPCVDAGWGTASPCPCLGVTHVFLQSSAEPSCQENNKPPSTPVTPMPAYSIMETPQLKKELSRFGVRALPKRQMVLKLKEIFQYTHQDMDSDFEDEIPSSQPPLQKSPAKCSRQSKEPMLLASQESAVSSVDGSDISFGSQSSFMNGFEACAFASEEEEEELPASQAAAREEDKLEAVRCYIRSNTALYNKILFYEPIELAELHTELKQNGIKISKAKLLDFLDAHCITFTTARARKEKEQKKKGNKKQRRRYRMKPTPPS
uniref:Structure-specific endonuclease subunit SLX4 n=1 Tax=Bubo bubo TaxID=30461 RepID=A0A8C0IEU7_BUBBB